MYHREYGRLPSEPRLSAYPREDSQRYEDIRANLERFETFLKSVEQVYTCDSKDRLVAE